MKTSFYLAVVSVLILFTGCSKSSKSEDKDWADYVVGTYNYTDVRSIDWAPDPEYVETVTGSFRVTKVDATHIKLSGDVETSGTISYCVGKGSTVSITFNPVSHNTEDRVDTYEFVGGLVEGVFTINYNVNGKWKKDGELKRIRISGAIEAKRVK